MSEATLVPLINGVPFPPGGGAGPNGFETCLTAFMVSPVAGGAPFTSIQAAYDAAKAAGGGTVYVCAGTYTEDVLMDTPGIDISTVPKNSQQAPNVVAAPSAARLVGNLQIDLTFAGTRDATTARWSGIDIIPATGAGVSFLGPNNAASYFYLTDCRVVSPDDDAIQIANTGTDGPLASVLDVQRATIERGDAGPAVALAGTVFPFTAFIAKNTSILSLSGKGVESASGFVGFDACILSTSDEGTDCVTTFMRADDTVWQGDTVPAIRLDGASIGQIVDNKATHDPDSLFVDGTGLFFHDTISFLNGANVPPWATTLTVFTDQAVPQEAHALVIDLDGTTVELTSQTNVLVESTAAGGTITLPPTTDRAGALRLKLGPGNIGAVTVAAQGGDTIRLGGAAPAASVPLTDPGFVLVSEPAGGSWEGWT